VTVRCFVGLSEGTLSDKNGDMSLHIHPKHLHRKMDCKIVAFHQQKKEYLNLDPEEIPGESRMGHPGSLAAHWNHTPFLYGAHPNVQKTCDQVASIFFGYPQGDIIVHLGAPGRGLYTRIQCLDQDFACFNCKIIVNLCQYKYNYSLYVSICVNVKVFFEVAWWASIGFTGYQDLQRNIYRIDYRGCFSQCFRLKWGWNPKHMKHAALGSLGSLGEEKTMAQIHPHPPYPPPGTSPRRPSRAFHSHRAAPSRSSFARLQRSSLFCRWKP
jgi:hypothetical protein